MRDGLTIEEFAARHLRHELVATEDALQRALADLRALRDAGRLRRLAVDLEYTENPDHDRRRLRLVQLGVGDEEAGVESRQLLVDAQAVDARPLQELLGDPAVRKLVHAPGGDYEQWFRYVGLAHEAELERWAFRNVYDSAARVGALNAADARLPAATRARVEELVGGREPDGRLLPQKLGRLAERLLGFPLSKRQRRSDWSRRELRPAQLRYAALDVAVAPFLVDRLCSLEAALRPLGVELDAAAEAEDEENRLRGADLALVPVARRQELDALVARSIRSAARRDGVERLPELSGPERRYVAGRFRRNRSRGVLREDGGGLAVVTVPLRRQRQLASLVARAVAAGGGRIELDGELELRVARQELRRRSEELELLPVECGAEVALRRDG